MTRRLTIFSRLFLVFWAGSILGPAQTIAQPKLDDQRGVLTYWQIIEPVLPSTVLISADLGPGNGFSHGSGVVLDRDGYIVTNAHVVKAAVRVTVRLHDKRELQARVVGADDFVDISLLKVEAPNLVPIPLGDSGSVKVGDIVFAIGNPLSLNETVTVGIVSALNRPPANSGEIGEYIQTDAAINPGNSGGALFDSRGRLVGINTANITTTHANIGLNLAIPTRIALAIASQLKSNGFVRRGRLGISTADLTPILAKKLGAQIEQGAVVETVDLDGSAAKAGILKNDIITQVNGAGVTGSNEFRVLVALSLPETELALGLYRNGNVLQKKVKLEGLVLISRGPEFNYFGARFVDVPKDHKLVNRVRGVLVASVDVGGIAAKHGIEAGDIIVDVNRIEGPLNFQELRAVDNLETFRKLIVAAGEVVILRFVHGNSIWRATIRCLECS